MSLSPAWSIEQVAGQPELLHRDKNLEYPSCGLKVCKPPWAIYFPSAASQHSQLSVPRRQDIPGRKMSRTSQG